MTAIVHAHTEASRYRLRMLCGLPFRELGTAHRWPKEWGQHDVTCPACRAILDGAHPASCGPVAVDADGRDVAP